ncbi:MAG: DUF932 domain-containing protein [Gemmataceae bacterium]|nr:DUF932 domain-containing protein [Gemmataceae bacterium]
MLHLGSSFHISFHEEHPMSTTTLVTHCGAREVSREELNQIEAPPPTQTWFPVRHSTVVESVSDLLQSGGFAIQKATYAVSRQGGARMFATLDLTTALSVGVTLAVGIRNSWDQSFPLGFCAGSRVFICDNLAFRADLLVARKHTRFGQDRFREAIAQAVASLGQFQQVEAERIRRFQHLTLSDECAESLILRSFERGFVSYRALPEVIQEWRQPSHDFGPEPSLWRLFNAWTSALAPVAKRSPQRFADDGPAAHARRASSAANFLGHGARRSDPVGMTNSS